MNILSSDKMLNRLLVCCGNDKMRHVRPVCCCILFIAGLAFPVQMDARTKTYPSTGEASNILTDLDKMKSSLSFIHDSLCYIKDPANSLAHFIDELQSLLNGKDTVINVVHLGDSHIQAGYLSGQTMRLLQKSFGNAGRGWITPYKLSKVNEPPDYYILSNVKDWIAGRCVQINPKCPWGIGGIGIQTQAKDINFRLIVTPTNGAGYSFNKILLYRDSDAAPMAPVAPNDEQPAMAFMGNEAYESIHIDTFTTANLVDTFSVRSIKSQKQTKTNLYYGFMLMNGNPGILYHSIGVNGAKFTDYTDREYVRRLSLLKPSLLIISLGTNESFGRAFSKEAFEMQLHSFILLVREEMPETTIIISTPAETFKRVYKNKKSQFVRNENIAKIAEVITDYTEKEGIACWDLFSISGGNNSCKNWYDAQMLGRDRIHFSQNGYREQGGLLFKALARSVGETFEGTFGEIGDTFEGTGESGETFGETGETFGDVGESGEMGDSRLRGNDVEIVEEMTMEHVLLSEEVEEVGDIRLHGNDMEGMGEIAMGHTQLSAGEMVWTDNTNPHKQWGFRNMIGMTWRKIINSRLFVKEDRYVE